MPGKAKMTAVDPAWTAANPSRPPSNRADQRGPRETRFSRFRQWLMAVRLAGLQGRAGLKNRVWRCLRLLAPAAEAALQEGRRWVRL